MLLLDMMQYQEVGGERAQQAPCLRARGGGEADYGSKESKAIGRRPYVLAAVHAHMNTLCCPKPALEEGKRSSWDVHTKLRRLYVPSAHS